MRPTPTADLDAILALQLTIAWAGEADSVPPRLGWWRTALHDPDAGLDLFARLLPATGAWAALEAAREAARRVDAAARRRHGRGDELVTLFHLGFELDEGLRDHLSVLKRTGASPGRRLSGLLGVCDDWSPGAFADWLACRAAAPVYEVVPLGRQLAGTWPTHPLEGALALALALLDAETGELPEAWPMPFFSPPSAARAVQGHDAAPRR